MQYDVVLLHQMSIAPLPPPHLAPLPAAEPLALIDKLPDVMLVSS